ncbi:MAG TPA: cupin domain-containing protein [Gammaproteobacteria bacterium]
MQRLILTFGLLAASVFSYVAVAQISLPEGRLVRFDEMEPRDVRDGIRVRPVRGDTVSFTRIELDAGAQTPNHNHADEQFIYLESGRASGYVGTIEYVLNPGDVIVIPAWVPHGFEALENTVWYEVHGPGQG